MKKENESTSFKNKFEKERIQIEERNIKIAMEER